LLCAIIGLAAIGLGVAACRGKAPAKPRAPGDNPLQPHFDNPSIRTEHKPPETEEVGWLTLRRENSAPDSLVAVKPPDLPEYVRSLYRIRPDRRFLYAAAELRRLTTGKPRTGVLSIRFGEDRWHVSLDGAPLGDLPEYPSFAQGKDFLLASGRAPTASKARSNAEPVSAADQAALENGAPSELLPALGRLNAAWTRSPGDPAVALACLRGLLWLDLQTYDELELSDPILGKSLALLALAENGGSTHHAEEECLLAWLLGYEDHAKLIAKELPSDEPVTALANWDRPTLKELAQRPKPDPRAEYLYLLLLARNGVKDELWFEEFNRSSWSRKVDIPSARLALTLNAFNLGTFPADLMKWRVLDEVSPAPRAAGTPSPIAQSDTDWRAIAMQSLGELSNAGVRHPESQLSVLEKAVNSEAIQLDGPLVDRQIFRAFRLANFYSSAYYSARYYFDGLGTTEGAESYGNSLANPPAGTAAELKDWILHRVHIRQSSDGLHDVAADLSRLRNIGVATLSRITFSLGITASGDRVSEKRAAAPAFFNRLDSRSSSLHAAARAVSNELFFDPAIKERCLRLATERGPHEVLYLPKALRFLGNRDRLRALVSDKTWSLGVRTSALQELAGLENIEPRILIERFRELIREDPKDNGPVWAAAITLESHSQISGALQVIDEWLKVYPEEDLTWAAMTSLKSRLLRKQGKFKEAWEYARRAAATWKADCLEEAALALIDLGRLDDALKVSRDLADRYGIDSGAHLIARILWTQEKDDEAAQLLISAQNKIREADWAGSLPEAFRQAFPKDNDPRAESAFLKLMVPDIPPSDRVWFIDNLTDNGRAKLAVKLCNRVGGLRPRGWATNATFHALQKAEGPTAARQWLSANATPAEVYRFSGQALSDGDCSLVWDLPDISDPTRNEILNLVRSVCLLYQPERSAEWRPKLIHYFEGRPQKDFVLYGLSFLGQIDRPTLFAQIKDLTYVSSVGWILGLTSAHENRYDEANAWFQVCMETLVTVPPRSWTSAILIRWNRANCVLSELARKKIY